MTHPPTLPATRMARQATVHLAASDTATVQVIANRAATSQPGRATPRPSAHP